MDIQCSNECIELDDIIFPDAFACEGAVVVQLVCVSSESYSRNIMIPRLHKWHNGSNAARCEAVAFDNECIQWFCH